MAKLRGVSRHFKTIPQTSCWMAYGGLLRYVQGLGRSMTYLRRNPLLTSIARFATRHALILLPAASAAFRRGERNGRLGRETAANTSPQNAQGRSNLDLGP